MMNSTVVYIIYVVLFLLMILDIIIGFSPILKAVFYGSCFVIGAFIYYFNYYKPKSDNENLEN